MKLKKGTIKHLQEYTSFKVKERGFEDETLHERLLLLTEELGELVKACRHLTGMNVDVNKKIKDKAGEEVVDVFNMLFAVANKLGLDVEEEFTKKEIEIDKRIYKRSKQK